MHYTHALLTYVIKVIIALCPENFCASKSADLKVLTFWTFDWRTLQHQLQQLFWSHLSPTFHEWHPFDNHIYLIFIIIIVVHVYHSEYHPNLLQLQYHSILTSNTIISITLIIINDSGRRTSWQLCALGIKWIFHPLMPTFCPSTSSSSASKSSIVTSPSIHMVA